MTDRDKFFWVIGMHGSNFVKAVTDLINMGVPEETIAKDLQQYYELATQEFIKAATRNQS